MGKKFLKNQLKTDLWNCTRNFKIFRTCLVKDWSIKKQKKDTVWGCPRNLLDVDHGTYPYVTSSNTVASSAATGTGCGPNSIHYVLGITKAILLELEKDHFQQS